MAKNTSILFGNYFDKFINSQVQSGRYSSASEVIKAALRFFEKEENKKKDLIKELKIGEKSVFNEDFDKSDFMKSLHMKYLKNEL
jgi:antitoxin ParD1/3/4